MDRNWRFRKELNQIFEEKQKRNSKYSLRSFATKLGVAPSSLCSILKGSRPLSDKNCWKFGKSLNMSEAQIRDLMQIKVPENQKMTFKELKDHQVALMSNWEHHAILHLIRLKTFQPNHKWIAKKLGIHVYQVDAAVERLVQLEFLEIKEDGTWIDKLGAADATLPSSSHLLRLVGDIQAQAYSSLNKFGSEERALSFLTLPVNKKKVSLVREKFISFKKEIDELLSSDDELDEVYHLNLGFFPAHKPESA